MKSKSYNLTKKELEKRGLQQLDCEYLKNFSYESVKAILDLPYWKEERYQHLLTTLIWFANASEITAILDMPEWDDPRFKHLLTPLIFYSQYNEIRDILNLPYWNDPRFAQLLSPTIWHSNLAEIKKILGLKYWKDPKYLPLLTPAIWFRTASEIESILELKDENNKSLWDNELFAPLLCSSIWLTSSENIIDIVKFPEWQDKRFQSLLCPSIWLARYAHRVRSYLDLPYWKDSRYEHLLVPTIFSISIKRINESIDCCEKLGIEEHINTGTLRKSPNQIRELCKYLEDSGEQVVENGRLHRYFSYSPSELKKKFGIDLKQFEVSGRKK